MSTRKVPDFVRNAAFDPTYLFANALAACATPSPTLIMLSNLVTMLKTYPWVAYGPVCSQCAASLAAGARCATHPDTIPGDLVAVAVAANSLHALRVILENTAKGPGRYGRVPLRAMALATRAATRRPEGISIVGYLLDTQAAPISRDALCVVVSSYLARYADYEQIRYMFWPWFDSPELSAAQDEVGERVLWWWGVICKKMFRPESCQALYAARDAELEELASRPRSAPPGGRAPPGGLEKAAETCESAEAWAEARARAADGPDGHEIQKDHAAALREIGDAAIELGRFIDADGAVRAIAALARLSPPPPESLAYLARHVELNYLDRNVELSPAVRLYRAKIFAFVERMLRRWRGTAELREARAGLANPAGWDALQEAMWGVDE